MVQSIQRTERFRSDVKKYTSVIEKLPDGHDKTELKKLLNSLIYEVKNIDNMYIDMVYSNQLTSTGKELRDKVTDIRKKIEEKISRLPNKIS